MASKAAETSTNGRYQPDEPREDYSYYESDLDAYVYDLPLVKAELEQLVSKERRSVNVACKNWEANSAASETYTWWCRKGTPIHRPTETKSDPVYKVYNATKNLELIVLGSFYFQRQQLGNKGEKKKDEKRMEYQSGCPAIEDLKRRAAEKMDCVPLHMMYLFMPRCYNICDFCRNVPRLPTSNQFCLKFVRMFDGNSIQSVGSSYLSRYFSCIPFKAIAKLTLHSILKTTKKEMKFFANCDYMLIVPDYATKSCSEPSVDRVLLLEAEENDDAEREDMVHLLERDVQLQLPAALSDEGDFQLEVRKRKIRYN